MDLATIIGIVAAVAIILVAILIGSSIVIFIDVPSLLIVVGGTTAVTLVKWPMATVIKSFILGVRSALFESSESPVELIALAEETAGTVQKEGLLALEGLQAKNIFFKKGISLCVDGHNEDYIRQVLTNEMKLDIEQSQAGEEMFRGIGDSAPAMGMIGTLIGLIQMLSNMSDPSSIGPAMAVALLTTLYGAFIAQVVALPIAEKLAVRSKQEKSMMGLVTESILGIQKGLSPRLLSEFLNTLIPKTERAAEEEPAAEEE